MKPEIAFCFLLFIPFVITEDYHRRSRDYNINSIGFQGSYSSGGCRKKHPDNRSLPGGAEACASHKPLKMKGLEKVSKRLCGEGYEYCSMSHKSLHHLSWKPETMPKTCFAFHYKKEKFAGYGHNCHKNLYYDGLLCCPTVIPKTSHKLRIGSDKFQKHHLTNLKRHQHVNFVKK